MPLFWEKDSSFKKEEEGSKFIWGEIKEGFKVEVVSKAYLHFDTWKGHSREKEQHILEKCSEQWEIQCG